MVGALQTPMTWFALAVLFVAILSGAPASLVGFGIGSLLTPLRNDQEATTIVQLNKGP